MIQHQQYPDVVQHFVEQGNFERISQIEKITQKRRIFRWLLLMGVIILVGVVILTIMFFIHNKSMNTQVLQNTPKTIDLLVKQNNNQIIKNDQGYFINGVDTKSVTKLLVQNHYKVDVTSQFFPNLRQLIYDDYNLHELELDSKLKLQTLTIKNTYLNSFGYNSTTLKNLNLDNNTVLFQFYQSNMPSLKNLSVKSSSIADWINNTFGQLLFVYFQNKYVRFPMLNAQKIHELVINNSLIYGKEEEISKITIKKLTLQNSFLNLTYQNNPYTQTILLNRSSTMNFTIINCSQLTKIVMKDTPDLKIVGIKHAPKLSELQLDIKTIQIFNVTQTNLTFISNQTAQNLRKLSILNTPLVQITRKALLSSSRLTNIELDYMNELWEDPSTFKYPELLFLRIVNFKNKQSFSIQNLNLFNLTLVNTSIPMLSINSKQIKSITLINVELQNFIIKNETKDTIYEIYFERVNISSIKNYNLTKLMALNIFESSTLKQITGCNFPEIKSFQVRNCPKLQLIQNNNIPCQSATIIYTPVLKWNQKYPQVNRLNLQNIGAQYLQTIINDYANTCKYLFYKMYSANITSNLSNSVLKNVRLQCYNDYQQIAVSLRHFLPYIFQTLQNLKEIILKNLIDNFYTLGSENLPDNDLIQQLQLMKEDGVTPSFILIGENKIGELSAPIKEIFPNVLIN